MRRGQDSLWRFLVLHQRPQQVNSFRFAPVLVAYRRGGVVPTARLSPNTEVEDQYEKDRHDASTLVADEEPERAGARCREEQRQKQLGSMEQINRRCSREMKLSGP